MEEIPISMNYAIKYYLNMSFMESPTKTMSENPNATNAVGHLNLVTVSFSITSEFDAGSG